MKLRVRVILFIGITLIGLVAGVYYLSSRLLLRSYTQLERQDAEQNVQRGGEAIAQSVSTLHEKSVDWAAWDDSYRFMADHNSAYIKSNLVESAVIDMQLDLVLYIDPRGRIYHAFPVKRLSGLPSPNPESVRTDLGFDDLRRITARSGGLFSGFVLGPQRPLMVSVRPILTTKKTGPPRGWLVFGRYFDSGELSRIADRTRLDLQAVTLDSPAVPKEFKQALTAITPSGRIQTRQLSAKSIAGYTLIPDVHGQPAIVLKVTLPRTIYQQGLVSVAYLVRLILVVALAFSLVILAVLEFFVLARLSRLTHQIVQVGDDAHPLNRVVLPGRDELSWLAGRINGMLQNLETSTANLRESREQLRTHNENLETMVEERTQQLMFQALHDTVTGLPNRLQFRNRLETALTQTSPQRTGVAVLFLDLDNFKVINDSLGHEAGDQLLIAVSERLQKCVRHDDMVARLGGDEFVILLANITDTQAACRVAEQIQTSLGAAVALSAGEAFTAASIGIAYTDDPRVLADSLLRDADTAMYHVKSAGKAGYIEFEPCMNDRLTERVQTEVGLRQALERDELRVYYQPLIDLKSGKLIGAEALVRWEHPTQGLISPGKFIPVAEDTGLIIPLGYFVLEVACVQANEWRNAEPENCNFTMNVNLSGKQLQRDDVVLRVKEILEKTGLPAANLKLEITESVMMADVEDAIRKLKELKALGIKLALDDFGTGYSSMASLSAFPLDTIKIDRAFISRISEHPEAESIVAAIVMLAKSLNMDVTGEGVENEEQVTFLQSLGCEIGQGYLFSRPVTSGALESLISAGPDSFVKATEARDAQMIQDYLLSPDLRKAA